MQLRRECTLAACSADSCTQCWAQTAQAPLLPSESPVCITAAHHGDLGWPASLEGQQSCQAQYPAHVPARYKRTHCQSDSLPQTLWQTTALWPPCSCRRPSLAAQQRRQFHCMTSRWPPFMPAWLHFTRCTSPRILYAMAGPVMWYGNIHDEVQQGPSRPRTASQRVPCCPGAAQQRASSQVRLQQRPSRYWRVLDASTHGLPHWCKEPQQHCCWSAISELCASHPLLASTPFRQQHSEQAEATQFTLVSAANVARRSSCVSSSRDRACR